MIPDLLRPSVRSLSLLMMAMIVLLLCVAVILARRTPDAAALPAAPVQVHAVESPSPSVYRTPPFAAVVRNRAGESETSSFLGELPSPDSWRDKTVAEPDSENVPL